MNEKSCRKEDFINKFPNPFSLFFLLILKGLIIIFTGPFNLIFVSLLGFRASFIHYVLSLLIKLSE